MAANRTAAERTSRDARWQMLAELKPPASAEGTPTTLATFVYAGGSAAYIDDVVSMRRDLVGSGLAALPVGGGGGSQSTADVYFHADDLFSVTSLTDSSGGVVERADYGDYGERLLMDAAGALVTTPDPATNRISSRVGNPWWFTGRELDQETGLYQYRYRFMNPRIGRFVSRDPIGTWGDAIHTGSAFAGFGSAPQQWLDPQGLGISSIDGAMEACARAPTLRSKIACYETLLAAMCAGDTTGRCAEILRRLENLRRQQQMMNTACPIPSTPAPTSVAPPASAPSNPTPTPSAPASPTTPNIPGFKPDPHSPGKFLNEPDGPMPSGFEPRGPRPNWFNPNGPDTLSPDPNHAPPKGPHWDWQPRGYPELKQPIWPGENYHPPMAFPPTP